MESKKNNSIYDIAKIVLAIMVVCIHSNLLPNILYPWIRIAVPLFFMISSYFFFLSLDSNEETNQKKLQKYVSRNLKLYIFWFIVLLPATAVIRNYFGEKNLLLLFLKIMKSFAFSSTFRASWYIMASIISTTIIYNASKKYNNKKLFIITLLIYIIICGRSSYMFIFDNCKIINIIMQKYESLIVPAYNSFPVALFWIVCGKIFADKKFNFNLKISYVALIISMIGLWFEWFIIKKISGIYNYDCYLLLFPVCMSIFNIINNIKPIYANTKELRKISTITYALHATVISGLRFMSNKIVLLKNDFIIFIITLIICWITYGIIKKLETNNKFKWLKYSH